MRFAGELFTPQPVQPTIALAPAVNVGIQGLTTAIKGYHAYKTGKSIGEAINDPEAARDAGGFGVKRITGDMLDGRREDMGGPTLRSPYHQ